MIDAIVARAGMGLVPTSIRHVVHCSGSASSPGEMGSCLAGVDAGG